MDFVIISFSKDKRSFTLLGAQDDIAIGNNTLELESKAASLIVSGRFFEWLFAPAGQVLGVETRLTVEDNIIRRFPFVLECTGVDTNCFVRIWFSEKRDGVSRHMLDWEDYYYSSEEGRLFIVLRTHLLNDEECEFLKNLIVARKEMAE